MDSTAKTLIQAYQLLPHPEGGFYKETYRSPVSIDTKALPDNFKGSRSVSTSIYFLLPKGNFSAFHRIESDECWHFYSGDPLHVYVIDANGVLTTIKLGKDILKGQHFQAVVPAGSWFASEPQGAFSFVGCTVAPGFDFGDFELASRSVLLNEYPQHEKLISRLCRA